MTHLTLPCQIMVICNDEEHVVEGDDAASGLDSKHCKEALDLFQFAKLGDWDPLVHRLRRCPSEVIRSVLDASAGIEGSTLLHVVVTSQKVPITVVETIVQEGGTPSVASIRNTLEQTPLHTAIHCIPERPDIVEYLVREAPETVSQWDHLHLRPIDILTMKVILSEEVVKYSHNEKMILEELWETAHILAHANNSWRDQPLRRQPIVHTCLQTLDFPFALKLRALRRFGKQLRQANDDGDLPLHVIARQPPLPKGEEVDDELDFLNRVLSLYPLGATEWNNARETPLLIAIRSGRKWNSGVLQLLEAHPAGLNDLKLPRVVYPTLFARILKADKKAILYEIINAQPQLFSPGFWGENTSELP